MVEVEIDKLTSLIEDVSNGCVLNTSASRLTEADLSTLGTGWRFDWKLELRQSEVVKLSVPEHGPHIHGLKSFQIEPDHILVRLVESHPTNVGKTKRFVGVPGNLFAYAAKVAFERGRDGFVCFIAKTVLIEHYKSTLKAIQIGTSQRMYLEPSASRELVNRYFGGC